MDIYVQEIMYTTYTEQLNSESKLRIQQLASAFPQILSKAVMYLNSAVPTCAWLRLYQAEDTEEHGEVGSLGK